MNILTQHTNSQTIMPLSPAKNDNKNKHVKTTIFYINDIHGQIPKMQRLTSAAQHAEILSEKSGTDLLKLSSGDTFIGSDDKRNAAAASFLNIADFDAQTLGNHEFDITASICAQLLKNTKTNILAMNLNFPDNNSELSKKVMRSVTIKGKNGELYGLIGIQPTDLNSRVKDKSILEGITVDDKEQTIEELKEEVKKLQSQGVNKIILLSHGGNTFEKELAQSVDGIDVILGGHSHDLITGVKEGENLFYSPSGEPVIITQAGRDGNHFGLLNLEFNENGQITFVQNNVLDTNIYAPNLMMSKTVDSILGKSPEIGVLKYSDSIPVNVLTEENPWADFVSDAIRRNLDADVVLINSANFRGSVDDGIITERDISSIFPFNNKLFKVKINEKDLVDAIKMCAKSMSSKNNKPGIMQVSGLTYKMDSLGNVLELVYTDKKGNKRNIDVNNPDSNKIYTAVYDEFLVKGGDNLDMLKRSDSQILERYDFDKDKVTIDYIKSIHEPFEVRKDNRIQIV